MKLNVNSSIDRINGYYYRDISLKKNDEILMGAECLKQEEEYGVRLNGIKQFVSIKEDTDGNEEIKNIINAISKLDLDYIIDISEEEKQTILNTYLGVLDANISKDKYYKTLNLSIKVDEKELVTNSYYISITKEEYNNLVIKILEKIKEDENILLKADYIEDKIKETYSEYQEEKALREILIDNIDDIIEKIKKTNIGNDKVKISVYEKEGKTVRINIEKNTSIFVIDFYNDSCIEMKKVDTREDDISETNIKVLRNADETKSSISVIYEQINNNEVVNNLQADYETVLDDSIITKNFKLKLLNEKYMTILNMKNQIDIVEQFENQITLDIDNVKLYELQEEQKNAIKDILNQNIREQVENLTTTVALDEYIKMLQNLNLVNSSYVELPEEDKVTEVQIKKFNMQFEFFVSENLTISDIKEMMKLLSVNMKDAKVLLKSGNIEDFDLDIFSKDEQKYKEYNDNISEILIYIEENLKNEDKEEAILKFVENNKNEKYTVSLEYNDEGLVDFVRIKIQEH